MEAREEEVTEEGINYVAMRNLFVREATEALNVKVEKKTRTTTIRESAQRVEMSKTVNLLVSPYQITPANIECLDVGSLCGDRWMSGRSSVRK